MKINHKSNSHYLHLNPKYSKPLKFGKTPNPFSRSVSSSNINGGTTSHGGSVPPRKGNNFGGGRNNGGRGNSNGGSEDNGQGSTNYFLGLTGVVGGFSLHTFGENIMSIEFIENLGNLTMFMGGIKSLQGLTQIIMGK